MTINECDLCGSTEHIPFLSRSDRVSGEKFSLVKCSHCGLIFLHNRPAPETIASYYPEDYECFSQASDGSASIQNWHYQRALRMKMDFVERFTSARGTLLDIGCGTGDFMVCAQTYGWKVKGVEMVDRAAQIARDANGLDVIAGSIDEIGNLPEKYSLVTLWDVLEHLPSPRRAFQIIHTLLEDNGILVFSIPNLRSFDRYLFADSWIGWDVPRHFYLFNESNINHLCEISGFKIIKNRTFIGGKGTFLLSLIQRFPARKQPIIDAEPIFSPLLWPYRQISYLLSRGPISTYVLKKIA